MEKRDSVRTSASYGDLHQRKIKGECCHPLDNSACPQDSARVGRREGKLAWSFAKHDRRGSTRLTKSRSEILHRRRGLLRAVPMTISARYGSGGRAYLVRRPTKYRWPPSPCQPEPGGVQGGVTWAGRWKEAGGEGGGSYSHERRDGRLGAAFRGRLGWTVLGGVQVEESR